MIKAAIQRDYTVKITGVEEMPKVVNVCLAGEIMERYPQARFYSVGQTRYHKDFDRFERECRVLSKKQIREECMASGYLAREELRAHIAKGLFVMKEIDKSGKLAADYLCFTAVLLDLAE